MVSSSLLIRSHGADADADDVVGSSTGIEMALGGLLLLLLLLLLPVATLALVEVLGGVKALADGASRRRRAAVLAKDAMLLSKEGKVESANRTTQKLKNKNEAKKSVLLSHVSRRKCECLGVKNVQACLANFVSAALADVLFISLMMLNSTAQSAMMEGAALAAFFR